MAAPESVRRVTVEDTTERLMLPAAPCGPAVPLAAKPGANPHHRAGPLATSKKSVYTLAALFSLDALAGGW